MIGICGDERCLCRSYREPTPASLTQREADLLSAAVWEFAAKHGIPLDDTESVPVGKHNISLEEE